ncbi:hypothetical protein INR49_006591, partial [Caranx melampygus]
MEESGSLGRSHSAALIRSTNREAAAALQCYCDRCSANSSCTTDGVCFVAIRKAGRTLTTERRQCVRDNELIPRDRPFICAPSAKHDTGIYPSAAPRTTATRSPTWTSSQ